MPVLMDTPRPEDLRGENRELRLEIKKLERELRVSKSYLDKVIKASEGKDTLGKALMEANAKQRAYTDMLLKSCPNIIILLDADGNFVMCTDAFLSETGTPNFNYIKDKNYLEVLGQYFSADSMEIFRETVDRALSSDETAGFNLWADFALNGERRFYSVEMRRAGAGLSGDAEIVAGVLIVMVDLTDVMREKQRAESANRAKSDFLAAMSHEIRTPMNVILGLGEMLERSDVTGSNRRYVSDIRKSANALLSIINDILDFSKIEAGRMELSAANYNLPLLLDSISSVFTLLCREKGIEMTHLFDARLPETVYGDEGRLRQVLTNLLSNAVKYTKQGGVTLRAWAENGTLRFDVTDTGIGIKDVDTEKLFKPFEQLDAIKNKNVVGTGLGLAITYNLCKLMGGSVWLESEYEKGSVFSVRLPYTAAKREEKTDEPAIGEFSASEARVLVVDDIDINLSVAEELLSIFDIKPDLAQSGEEALRKAREKEYDIIFMDHMMPQMDGMEATRYIRKMGGSRAAVPIIALTANIISGMDQLYLENGMNDFLPKPLEIPALSACLSKWLPARVMATAIT
ncbi:MAG: response regulator [Clostridiales bacterium]|nr:response regulator [Clostridiales bacterium]